MVLYQSFVRENVDMLICFARYCHTVQLAYLYRKSRIQPETRIGVQLENR